MNILKKIVFILSPHERKRAVLLMLMLLVMAILDMIGVASIMPFITVLTNPDIIENNFLLKFTYEYSSIVGVNNVDEFVILLGILVFFVLVTSLIFKALTNYIQLRFALMREYSIGIRLKQGYLSQPYSWFLNRHSADFGKTILSEIYLVVSQALVPMISLIANFLVVLAILILLVIIDPVIAVFISFTFGLTYFLIFRIVKNYLRTIGTERLKVNQLRFTSVSEAFGAAKEVKLGGLEYVYIGRFAETSKIYAKHQATAQVLSTIPRFIVEAIGFGGIILVILYFLSKTSNFTSALPIIAV
jgi:ABC-type bacteriocin/lantibiotic exporter with double-glycine peptidase domain